MISRADRATFDAAIDRFKTKHPEVEGQVGVWLDLALKDFADYLGEFLEDISVDERAQGVALVADLAILDNAAAWQRACKERP